MKVLFISSTTKKGIPSPLIVNQAESIKSEGVDVDFFSIKEKGIKGYIKSIFKLRKFVKKRSYDIYHAHYGLSAIVATFAGLKPLVVSLMGSDVKEGGWQLKLIKLMKKYYWKATIAKSNELANIVGSNKVSIIPNGVNIELFHPIDQNKAKKALNLPDNKKHMFFAANPTRPEKNFQLAKNAFTKLGREDWDLIVMENIPHEKVPLYMNASDIVLLSSLWEGSPNVIKEALACNKVIVATKVGDIEWLFKNVNGVFLSELDLSSYTNQLQNACDYLNNSGTSSGRERIIELGLAHNIVAQKIISIYKDISSKKQNSNPK